MSLFFACFFSACQTLPTGDAEVAKLNALTDEAQANAVISTQANIPVAPAPTDSSKPAPAEVVEASQPDDVWERMRRNFRLIPSMHPKVVRELAWYRSHPAYLERIQERAKPYIYFILEELEKRDMPAEIALLPAVESAFQPFAYSPGRAAGIWQFIPSTGRGFGLKQNWWYDARRDVVASTRAALDYLKLLNQQFDGDWELALAAYNSGAGTVRSAIRKNRKRGKATDFWSLQLPRETRQYVPRLLAISELFANSQRYAIELQEVPDQPYFETVDIGSQLDLALAAEMAGLTIQEIYQLNAGFNRWATAPDGPHRLHLPLDKAAGFRERLASLPDIRRVNWQRYKIKSGDNLSQIAKHHGTTTKLLKKVNKLSSSRIRAGKHLLIPVSVNRLDQYALSVEQRKAQIQNKSRKGHKQRYVVKSGDSLWKIARAHNISHKQLAKWNGMAPGDPIRPGQKLVLWTPRPKSAYSASRLDLQPAGIQNTLSYRVRRGDSLSRIAQRFSVSVNELRKWNELQNKYLQPGQRLRLYVDVTEQTTM